MSLCTRGFPLLLFLVLLTSAGTLLAQSPIGQWVTIDDERNEPRSLVSIYEEQGMLYAKVDSIYFREDEPHDPVCEKCKGARKDQPILGMVIMWDMKQKGDQWKKGRILDPEKGKTYKCKIWLKDGNLKVRGYIGPFYRTQTWLPADSNDMQESAQ